MYAISEKHKSVTPRIIIHGGAGNITRANLPSEAYQAYRNALLGILKQAECRLQVPNASALDVATYAVSLLEDCPLFNAGHGAVYTRAGTHELEASVMVSRGYKKRGVGVMNVTDVRNPILLARELLIRGEDSNGGGAQGHCQLQGHTCSTLAKEWGLEMTAPSHFWTKKRWDEHRNGLGLSHTQEEYDEARRAADSKCNGFRAENTIHDSQFGGPSWNGRDYLPQGTVGAVVLDSSGIVAVATSTGGLTNKLPGRIGDTPTIGAGFFADEWQHVTEHAEIVSTPVQRVASAITECLPTLTSYYSSPSEDPYQECTIRASAIRAVAMSGTGNGDSFLKLSAVRTAAAIAQFASPTLQYDTGQQYRALQEAVTAVAGPHGTLQRSAGDRWHKTGEGEGGIIGIDCVNGQGEIVYDFNCGGMFRAWSDDNGRERMMVFKEEY